MTKKIASWIIVALINLAAWPQLILAQEDQVDPALNRLTNVTQNTGLYTSTPATPSIIIMRGIQIALGFVGLIFFLQIFFSGFQWMTSAANQEKIKKAKQRLTNAVIGLVIILAAYLITVAISSLLLKTTGQTIIQ